MLPFYNVTMNRLSASLISLLAFAVFCATLTYWVITLTKPNPLPNSAADVHAPVSVDAAAHLFGDDASQESRIRLSGILSMGGGAAAIVSVDGAPSRVVAIGQPIDGGITLAAVHARSIVVDQSGTQSEINLTQSTGNVGGAGGVIYMH